MCPQTRARPSRRFLRSESARDWQRRQGWPTPSPCESAVMRPKGTVKQLSGAASSEILMPHANSRTNPHQIQSLVPACGKPKSSLAVKHDQQTAQPVLLPRESRHARMAIRANADNLRPAQNLRFPVANATEKADRNQFRPR